MFMYSRDQIASGDLLIWERDKWSTKSNFYLNLIRILTRSQFAHVGIAWRLEGRLYVVEATMPVVRISPVKARDEFYHIGMGVQWDKRSEDYLIDKIGLRYSMADSIRAYLGKTLDRDDSYQCVELCHEFYTNHGFDLAQNFTPSGLVDSIMNTYQKSVKLMRSLETV